LNRAADARETFDALQARKPSGYLSVATWVGEAEAAVALGDHARALGIYEKLTADRTVLNDPCRSRPRRRVWRPAQDGRGVAPIYYEFP
jgi:hypothetical protein